MDELNLRECLKGHVWMKENKTDQSEMGAGNEDDTVNAARGKLLQKVRVIIRNVTYCRGLQS